MVPTTSDTTRTSTAAPTSRSKFRSKEEPSGGLTDGELFTITDRSTNTVVQFEFDRNGTVTPNAIPISLDDLILQIPPEGASSGGIVDGDSFIINDNQGSGDVVFEFDTELFNPFNVTGTFTVSPGAIAIFIDPTFDTAASIASQVAFAISGAGVGLNPSTTGTNTIQLNTDGHTVDVGGAPTMELLTVPRTQFEIVSLLTDAIRTAGVGLAPAPSIQTFTTFFGQVFTFSTGGISLNVRDHIIDTSLAPNFTKLTPVDTGQYDLSIDIVEPFEFFRENDRINLPTATSVTPVWPAQYVRRRATGRSQQPHQDSDQFRDDCRRDCHRGSQRDWPVRRRLLRPDRGCWWRTDCRWRDLLDQRRQCHREL